MMEKTIKFLQENPYLVLLTVILGVGGGIIGVVTGWNQFYSAMNSKVSIPGWAILLIFFAFIAVVIVADSSKKKDTISSKKLIKYEGKSFGVQTVKLDGKEFTRCAFNGTKLVFGAKYTVSLSHCQLNDVSFMFDDHAELTLVWLSNMYRDMPGIRPTLDATFEAIKGGNLPISPPTYNE